MVQPECTGPREVNVRGKENPFSRCVRDMNRNYPTGSGKKVIGRVL